MPPSTGPLSTRSCELGFRHQAVARESRRGIIGPCYATRHPNWLLIDIWPANTRCKHVRSQQKKPNSTLFCLRPSKMAAYCPYALRKSFVGMHIHREKSIIAPCLASNSQALAQMNESGNRVMQSQLAPRFTFQICASRRRRSTGRGPRPNGRQPSTRTGSGVWARFQPHQPKHLSSRDCRQTEDQMGAWANPRFGYAHCALRTPACANAIHAAFGRL